MGCCGSMFEDKRPVLKVTVVRGEKFERSSSNDAESNLFVQAKYAPAISEVDQKKHGPGKNVTTLKTKIIRSTNQAVEWNEEILIHIASISAKYSLELCVCDSLIAGNKIVTNLIDHPVATIHYARHPANVDLLEAGNTPKHEYDPSDGNGFAFLPSEWNEEYTYKLELQKGNHSSGILHVKCEFVHPHYRESLVRTNTTQTDGGINGGNGHQDNDYHKLEDDNK